MTAIECANHPDTAAALIRELTRQIENTASARKHAVFCAALTGIISSDRLTQCGSEVTSAVTRALEVVNHYQTTNTEAKLNKPC